MASYKVLKSVAHNFGASFVSVMNYVGNDYAMCHLIRRAKLTGSRQLSVNLRTRGAGPIELLSPHLVQSIESYCKDFGRLVTTGGAAMDMIDAAELQVKIAIGRTVGAPSKSLHGRVTATVRILDDRGKEHVGRVTEAYECAPLR